MILYFSLFFQYFHFFFLYFIFLFSFDDIQSPLTKSLICHCFFDLDFKTLFFCIDCWCPLLRFINNQNFDLVVSGLDFLFFYFLFFFCNILFDGSDISIDKMLFCDLFYFKDWILFVTNFFFQSLALFQIQYQQLNIPQSLFFRNFF